MLRTTKSRLSLLLLGLVALASQAGATDAAQAAPPMTLDAYRNVRHDVPYVLTMCTKFGQLHYVGVAHTPDARSPSATALSDELDALLPDMLLIEGPVFESKQTLAQTVKAYGESGVLLYEAAARSLPIASLDLPLHREMALVAERFGRDAAATFYGLRYITQEIATGTEAKSPTELASIAATWLARQQLLDTQQATAQALIAMVTSIRPGDWTSIPPDEFDPLRGNGLMGSIARFLVTMRDEHMVAVIVRELATRRRVLAQAGASHVVMQEDALATRLGCAAVPRAAKSHRASPSVHQCDATCSQ